MHGSNFVRLRNRFGREICSGMVTWSADHVYYTRGSTSCERGFWLCWHPFRREAVGKVVLSSAIQNVGRQWIAMCFWFQMMRMDSLIDTWKAIGTGTSNCQVLTFQSQQRNKTGHITKNRFKLERKALSIVLYLHAQVIKCSLHTVLFTNDDFSDVGGWKLWRIWNPEQLKQSFTGPICVRGNLAVCLYKLSFLIYSTAPFHNQISFTGVRNDQNHCHAIQSSRQSWTCLLVCIAAVPAKWHKTIMIIIFLVKCISNVVLHCQWFQRFVTKLFTQNRSGPACQTLMKYVRAKLLKEPELYRCLWYLVIFGGTNCAAYQWL